MNFFLRDMNLLTALTAAALSGIGTQTSADGFAYKRDGQSAIITRYTGKAATPVIPNKIDGLPVTEIGVYAFYGCTGLTGVSIPASVTEIGGGAFYGCTGLTGIAVDNGNTAYIGIDGVIFTKDQKTLIAYPAGKKGTYTIPASVTILGGAAFEGCTGLTGVSIPASVMKIGGGVFYGCTGLTSIAVDNGNTAYIGIDGVVFTKDQKTLIAYPAGKKGTYTIPASVTEIGGGVFYGCTGLTGIAVDNGNTAYIGIDGVVFTKDQKTLIAYPAGKKGTYTIPASVTILGGAAFEGCTGLTGVSIPASVIKIEDGAFYGCTGLTSVSIPVSVTVIGDEAFYGCTELTGVTLSRWTRVENGAFPEGARLTYID